MMICFSIVDNYISLIETCLTEDLNRIVNWLNNNYLFLNYVKSKVMLMGTHQRLKTVYFKQFYH